MFEQDDVRFAGLLALISVALGVAMGFGWKEPPLPQPKAPHNVAVRFLSAPPAPVQAGTTSRQTIVASKPLPAKPKPRQPPKLPTMQPAKLPPAERDAPQTVEAPPTIIESTAKLQLPENLNARLAMPEAASAPMPPLAIATPPDTPPPPPDGEEVPVNPFPVKPYGNTVVVAFKIDSEGKILDSTILVPSWNTLGDMSIRLAAQTNEAKSIRYTNITPPIEPGQTRWIVLPHSWGADQSGNSLP